MLAERFRALWMDNRRYLLIGSLLMLFGIIFGYLEASLVEKLAQQMIEQIRKIADQIQKNGHPTAVFWMILFNNLFSSLMMMVLGVLFAFFPIYGLVANGVLLGFLLDKMGDAGLNPLVVLTVGILPHGIFELPAVVFAASFGIRYGVLTWRTVAFIWNAEGRGKLKREWTAGVKQFPLAVLVIAILLVVAALVESVITPLLIQNTIGTQFKFMK
ncbi:UNVERIFIED_CONTAM: stage II sporulation protein M [Brevibacillus sp. OAP136]|uniref:stage II sporulation protein M n=1 Tax=Brevibacillus fluminis TaxID=511487 RepID=UPI001FE882D7|nr:stage II sporulation protein M [Brevibacillus fluminis]